MRIARPSWSTRAPNSASASSVWSRVRTGSITDVTPSANSPASRTADFTCALGTGSVYSSGRELRAFDFEWREASFARFDPRTHLRERIHHPAHGPPPQRSVSVDDGSKFLAGENSSEQTHRGAGISGVERAARFAQSTKPCTHDAHAVTLGIHLDAQARKAIERAAAIGGGGKMRDLAGTFGQRRKHRVPVRNGFIAGNFE